MKNLIFLLCAIFAEDNYSVAREKMVKEQIEYRGIKDERILYAMKKVPRHKFIPSKYIDLYDPYGDYPVPIEEGQTISQPYIVALMTEVLKLKQGDKVLEIGTGSGYQAAILAELKCKVYTIEIIDSLAKNAQEIFKELGYNDIKVKVGDGYIGWKEYSPFNAIIVTCSPDHIPEPLINQLAENGRMVIPVGEKFVQELLLITKEKDKLKKEKIIDVLFIPMQGKGIKLKK